MTLDDAIGIVREEYTRAKSRFGVDNAVKRPSEWVALFAGRLGHLANASSSKNQTWFAEELAKTAATAISAMTCIPDMSFASIGAEGLAVVDRVDTPFPRIATKVSEPPVDAVLVADDVVSVVVGGGKAWVVKKG